ncbi:hypothetical protein DINM_003426 [Dirofilaria immitis]|nr:hypothetical protein [Dirofilaria immitis]
MELGLEIARLVIDNRGDSDCSEQILQRSREIIEAGSLLSIHTFIVHQHCNLKFSSCTGVFLLEEWMIKIIPKEKSGEKILDGLFLKNAVRSYLHFSQLNSWLTCNGEQPSNDTICKYRISVNNVCLGDQLRNFESHEFPLGQLDLLFSVYVTVKWRKYGASLHLSSCSGSAGNFTFYVPVGCQQNSQEERIESEDVQEVRDEKTLLGNEQIVKSSVESLLSSESSIEIGFPLQTVPPSLSSRRETLPRRSLLASAFRFMSTASKTFSKTTGLPLNSSPAPFSRNGKFVEDQPAKNTSNRVLEKTDTEGTRADILRKLAAYHFNADEKSSNASYYRNRCTGRNISSSNGLLCNFEESALNGRLDLVTSLDGFHLQIAASDETCSPHLTLPVTTFFFNMPEDEAPLPYMGFCSLENMRKGYRIPRKGILQAVIIYVDSVILNSRSESL